MREIVASGGGGGCGCGCGFDGFVLVTGYLGGWFKGKEWKVYWVVQVSWAVSEKDKCEGGERV